MRPILRSAPQSREQPQPPVGDGSTRVPPPSRAEQLQAWNNGITAFSAVTSLLAAFIAYRALVIQTLAPRRERRIASYHALVVTPALSLLPDFEEEAAAFIERRQRDLTELIGAGTPIPKVHDHIASSVAEFRAMLLPVTYRLVGAASAWGDGNLAGEVNAALEGLEDEVTEAIDKLQNQKRVAPGPVSFLRTGIANALGLIVHYDADPPVPGPVRRTLRKVPLLGRLL